MQIFLSQEVTLLQLVCLEGIFGAYILVASSHVRVISGFKFTFQELKSEVTSLLKEKNESQPLVFKAHQGKRLTAESLSSPLQSTLLRYVDPKRILLTCGLRPLPKHLPDLNV